MLTTRSPDGVSIVNDRDHVGLANGTASPEEHLPRYFAKSGFSANDNPNRIKKSGNGKGNCNASAQLLDAMTSKFEVVEAEPMFKENVHGASAHDYAVLEKTMSME
ncbi:unnamed protein product [Aureobasidium pullulans]|nr:unnamed protein product [Aureobasidium pullulans]